MAMRRRKFITLLGGVIAWPLAALAQQKQAHRVGILSQDLQPGLLEAFKDELQRLGYVEGRDISLELRNAAGDNERLPTLADDLGGTADHVHALVSLGRVHAVAEVVQHMKVESSKWLKARGATGFAWQAGYGAFSIGASQVGTLVRYIQRQEAHHRTTTFQD